MIIVLMGRCTASYIESVHAPVLDYEYNELLCVVKCNILNKKLYLLVHVCVCVCVF